MQTVQDMERHKTAQAIAAHLALVGTDVQAWVNLFAEDAIVEFPYASAFGSPERLEGKSALYKHMKDVPAQGATPKICANLLMPSNAKENYENCDRRRLR